MIRKAFVYTNDDEAPPPPVFSFVVDEATASCLAIGAVTTTLQEQAYAAVHWSLEDIADDAAKQREQSSRLRASQRKNAKGAEARQAKGAKRGHR